MRLQDHDERDRVLGAHNAAQYLLPRRRLLQWGDALDRWRAHALPASVA